MYFLHWHAKPTAKHTRRFVTQAKVIFFSDLCKKCCNFALHK